VWSICRRKFGEGQAHSRHGTPPLQGPWEDQAFGLRAPRAQSMFKMSLLDLGTLENFLVGQHKL
jgi:hypothetical protein